MRVQTKNKVLRDNDRLTFRVLILSNLGLGLSANLLLGHFNRVFPVLLTIADYYIVPRHGNLVIFNADTKTTNTRTRRNHRHGDNDYGNFRLRYLLLVSRVVVSGVVTAAKAASLR